MRKAKPGSYNQKSKGRREILIFLKATQYFVSDTPSFLFFLRQSLSAGKWLPSKFQCFETNQLTYRIYHFLHIMTHIELGFPRKVGGHN